MQWLRRLPGVGRKIAAAVLTSARCAGVSWSSTPHLLAGREAVGLLPADAGLRGRARAVMRRVPDLWTPNDLSESTSS